MSFFYCIATLLEFAGVHYFTKVGSGEINALTDDEWEDVGETIEHGGTVHSSRDLSPSQNQLLGSQSTSARKRNSIICPIYNVNVGRFSHYHWFWFISFRITTNQIRMFFLTLGSINNVSIFIALHHGANNTNWTTESQKMEANLVMLLGRWQIPATTTTRSHGKKWVILYFRQN